MSESESTTIEILRSKLVGLEEWTRNRERKQDEMYEAFLSTLTEIRNTLVEHKIELVRIRDRDVSDRELYRKDIEQQRTLCAQHREITARVPNISSDIAELTRDVKDLTETVKEHGTGIKDLEAFRNKTLGVIAAASTIGGLVGTVISFIGQFMFGK